MQRLHSMRLFFTVVLLIACCAGTKAQNAVAKIKYEQAEEAYVKADFFTAVARLNEAEQLLGGTNPKILYLRIMSQDKLLDGDSSLVVPLRKSCQFYLKNYELTPNLEAKYKDVYLVSERLLQYESNADFLTGEQSYIVKDYTTALVHYKKAAAVGFARAMTRIGIMNEFGFGIEKNPAEARRWYERSAEKGNGYGQYWLGRSYFHGSGGAENIEQAQQLFLQAASKNIILAMNGLGDIYNFKLKVGSKAYEWYKKGMDKNDPYSQHMVAMFHLYGMGGVKKDEATAMALFKKAMEGWPDAITMIGFIYQNGYGVPKDYAQAFNWYLKGSEKGNTGSMQMLAKLYEQGLGVKKNKKLAGEWNSKAAAAKAAR